ncbi:fimbrial biogenesis chaperone [Cupriavidus sp. 30B13]|uniref:fimbrial biogenesis chaperone n=1 Tax=Cupriavidus sp. 30B13 TaxID=3384241 RepID=UPI003B8F6943
MNAPILASPPRRPAGAPCRLALSGLAAAALACAPARAATSVMIWPIDPVIESGQRAAALWLENRDTRPVTLQVRVMGWRQQAGEDVLSADQDRVAGSPPMATVPPGRRQLIRLTRLREAVPGTEQAYRVLIDELPQPRDAGEAADVADAADAGGGARQEAPSFGIRFQMRYSIPLFVYGEGVRATAMPDQRGDAAAARPALSWRLDEAGGKRWLAISNRGAVHARVTGASFETAGSQAVLAPGLLGYVLPGARVRWELPRELRPDPHARLLATVNGTPGVVLDAEAAGAGQ